MGWVSTIVLLPYLHFNSLEETTRCAPVKYGKLFTDGSSERDTTERSDAESGSHSGLS